LSKSDIPTLANTCSQGCGVGAGVGVVEKFWVESESDV